jgi:ATP-dependent DNA helicase 2 subunit 1
MKNGSSVACGVMILPALAGLYLLGFKARSCLRPWHTWRQSTFVYPDERAMPGSTTAFIALHQAMLEADRRV